MIKKSPICADASDDVFTVAGVEDRKKIPPDERFSAPEIHLKDMMARNLINDLKALIEGQFILFIPARFG